MTLAMPPGLVQTELHPLDGARHLRAAGLVPLRPHDLRHTAVALWIAAGGAVVELPAAPSRPQRGPRRSKNKEGPARHRA
jgi:hypothetical protein